MEGSYSVECQCGRRAEFCDMFFCPKCCQMKCPLLTCTISSIDAAICPVCMKGCTLSESHINANRCQQCFACPRCSQALRATQLYSIKQYQTACELEAIDVAEADEPKFALYCTGCNWSSIGSACVGSTPSALFANANTAYADKMKATHSTSDLLHAYKSEHLMPQKKLEAGAVPSSKGYTYQRSTKAASSIGTKTSYETDTLEPIATAVVDNSDDRRAKYAAACLALEAARSEGKATGQSTSRSLAKKAQSTPDSSSHSTTVSYMQPRNDTLATVGDATGWYRGSGLDDTAVPVALQPLLRRRCQQCVTRGDPGILSLPNPLPYALIANGGRPEHKPGLFYRKNVTAVSVMPLLQLWPQLPGFPTKTDIYTGKVPFQWSLPMRKSFQKHVKGMAAGETLACVLRVINPSFSPVSLAFFDSGSDASHAADTRIIFAAEHGSTRSDEPVAFVHVQGYEEVSIDDDDDVDEAEKAAAMTYFDSPETKSFVTSHWRHTASLQCNLVASNPGSCVVALRVAFRLAPETLSSLTGDAFTVGGSQIDTTLHWAV